LPDILVLKMLVTMIVVVGLSLLAEHVSTRLAGILAGYPHGIAIVLYFLGLEQGVAFAAQASIYAIGGLSANILMVYGYYLICRSNMAANLFAAVVGSIVVFFLASLALKPLEMSQIVAAAISIGIILLVAALLRNIDNIRVTASIKTGYPELLFRAFLSALIVLIVTETADVVGPEWSGLFAGFPVVTFPLLIIIHRRYGSKPVSTMVKNYPWGLLALVIYTVTVSWAYPVMGLGWGTVVGFLVATVYLAVLSYANRNKHAIKVRQERQSP
jgi:hypothetical protein